MRKSIGTSTVIKNPMPPAGVKILFLLGWMDVVVTRSRQVVVLATVCRLARGVAR